MLSNGWIKIFRKFLYWEWFDTPEMVQLYLYLLLNASPEDDVWKGIKIRRGQLFRGRNTICNDLRMSVQTLRTCLNRLEKTGEIQREVFKKATIQGTLITVCNYESYQSEATDLQPTSNRPLTNLQPTSNRPLTIDKEEREEEKNNNILPDFFQNRVEEGEKTAKTTKKKKATNPLVTPCRKVFEDYFLSIFGEAYYWVAKDAVAMNAIIKKITNSRMAKNKNVDDDDIVDAFGVMLTTIQDDWLLKNFSVTNINSKYNEIVAQAKMKSNGANRNISQGRITKSEANRIVTQQAAADIAMLLGVES